MMLLGENETESVLQRLDRLNHEEARTTAAQTLEVVYGLVKNMKVVMNGALHVPSLRSTMLNICFTGGKTSTEDIRQALGVYLSPFEVYGC